MTTAPCHIRNELLGTASPAYTAGCVPPDECNRWAEGHYSLHPKKKNKLEAMGALRAIYADTLKRRAMDDNHLRWIQTENWQREHGRFCPPLDTWIGNDGFLYPPIAFSHTATNDPFLEVNTLGEDAR